MTIHWSGWFTGSATLLAVLVALYQAQAGQRDASQTRGPLSDRWYIHYK